MSRSDDLRLLDILDAADLIARLVARGRAAFAEDEAILPAVERQLEIIGESATVLSDQARFSIPDVRWQDLRRLRILLAHHYHRVDPAQVWAIATGDAALLASSISAARPDLRA